jgi:hypothetical protein
MSRVSPGLQACANNPALQEQCYDNLRISKNAWDTNLIKVSQSPTTHGTGTELDHRQIPSTSQLIGKPAEEVHSQLSQLMRRVVSLNIFLSSAGTLPLCLIQTGTKVDGS